MTMTTEYPEIDPATILEVADEYDQEQHDRDDKSRDGGFCSNRPQCDPDAWLEAWRPEEDEPAPEEDADEEAEGEGGNEP